MSCKIFHLWSNILIKANIPFRIVLIKVFLKFIERDLVSAFLFSIILALWLNSIICKVDIFAMKVL
jgi:hypothetical protein